ncbi:MAG: RusA family crossover junction endodeoxyribonuclease [Mogibacterium sp.]|nr:RusA family crossover junction endodeoxyribonuclease [Mogibacterium sp.]
MMLFTIPGEPQGKGRPRFYNGHAVTPKETREYEDKVKQCFFVQGGKQIPLTKTVKTSAGDRECPQAVKVEVWAFLKPPKSSPLWKRGAMLLGVIMPTKKPDVDNIGKIILDGLNGAAWQDDSAVVDLTIHKCYDKDPRVVVEIDEI